MFYLVVEGVGGELHGAGDDGLRGDSVEDGSVFEDDEAGHVGHNVPLLELLEVQDLDIGEPHALDEVGRAHDALGAPLRGVVVDHQPNWLRKKVSEKKYYLEKN